MKSDSLEVVEKPTYEEFRRHFLRTRRPVRIVGGIDGWPAMKRWSFDYIGKKLGARQVSPVVLSDGHLNLDVTKGICSRDMDFATYAGLLRDAGSPPYYLRLPLTGDVQKLFSDDYVTPDYCQKNIRLVSNLWVGGRGTNSSIHYDMTHNIVAQVVGRRRVMLFGPEQSENLHPFHYKTLHWHHSQVRAEAPDYQRFPKYKDARPIVTELNPGEMLFIPKGVWHRFETIEDAIAINFFWLTKRLAPKIAMARLLWLASGRRT